MPEQAYKGSPSLWVTEAPGWGQEPPRRWITTAAVSSIRHRLSLSFLNAMLSAFRLLASRCDKDRGATTVERGMGWMILRRERSVAFFFEFTQRLALLWPQVRVVYRENPSKGMVSKMTAMSTELCGIPGGVIRQGTTSVVSTICQFSSSPFPLLQKDEFAQEGALGSSVVNVCVSLFGEGS
ncbi:hypothetical protein B0H11DRAFT_1910751 [Mycena galericulata]|nr:hypothetical protein B0H11DRAFT_1910751 [Mycena galericulata]